MGTVLEPRRGDWARDAYYRFLTVFFIASQAAYPIHEDLLAAAGQIPERVRAALDDGEAEEQARALMQQYEKEMESGEPVPVDLLTFYLTQEEVAGGETHERVEAARAKFEFRMRYAQEMQTKGKNRDEVLGYVLKQQGEYDDTKSRLVSLLVDGAGDCEARQRYISSAFQVLYPEDVQAGKLKTEVFRPWVDKMGVMHDGHVRAVVEEGSRVAVLEGDAVKWDKKEVHEQIGMHEATQLAVKSFAVAEGVSTFEKENTGLQKKLAKAVAKDSDNLEAGDALDYAKKLVHTGLTDNSVSAYPVSLATYGHEGDNGARDVDRRQVAGSWAPSHYEWDKAIVLELREPKPILTAENIQSAFITPKPGPMAEKPYIDLGRFSKLTEEGVRAVIVERDRRIAVIQSDLGRQGKQDPSSVFPMRVTNNNELSPELFEGHPGHFIVDDRIGLPSFEEISTRSLEFRFGGDNVALLKAKWTKDARVKIVADGTDHHLALFNVQNLDGVRELMITQAPGGSKDISLATPEWEDMHFDKVNISRVNVPQFGALRVREVSYMPTEPPTSGSMAYVQASKVEVFYGLAKTGDAVLHGDVFRVEGPGMHESIGASVLAVHAPIIGREIFRGNFFEEVRLDSMMFESGALKGLRADTCTFLVEPQSLSVKIPQVMGAPEGSPVLFEGAGVKRILFVLSNPAGMDEKAMKGDGKSGPGSVLREQIRTAQENEILPTDVPIYVMDREMYNSLNETQGNPSNWSSAAFRSVDYLKGEFAK